MADLEHTEDVASNLTAPDSGGSLNAVEPEGDKFASIHDAKCADAEQFLAQQNSPDKPRDFQLETDNQALQGIEDDQQERDVEEPPPSTSDESDYDAVLSLRVADEESGGEDKKEAETSAEDDREGCVEGNEPNTNIERAHSNLCNGSMRSEQGESVSQLDDLNESAGKTLNVERLNDENLGVIQDTDTASTVSRGSLGGDRASDVAPDIIDSPKTQDKIVVDSMTVASEAAPNGEKGIRDISQSSVSQAPAGKTGRTGRTSAYSATSHNTETSEGTRLMTLRGKANTPNSYYTDVTAEIKNIENRALESREAVFQRAMTLMSTRCTSVTQMMEPLLSFRNEPYGVHIPQYFYIQQRKPQPAPPLKAWRGYNGNVYFEPLHISSLNAGNGSGAGRLHNEVLSQSRTERIRNLIRTRKPSARSGPVSRSTTRQSGVTIRTCPTSLGVVMLDRNVVLSQQNSTLEEDLLLLQSQESTGSLTTRPRQPGASNGSCLQRRSAPPVRSKICRGSMVHKSKSAKLRKGPTLGIAGDKFAAPTLTSPLLRTQTQYSLSSQRAAMNSPDVVHHGPYEHLPPLEQVRASLRHMDSEKGRAANYGRTVTVTDSPKPFIKYSPDFKARYHNRAPYC